MGGFWQLLFQFVMVGLRWCVDKVQLFAFEENLPIHHNPLNLLQMMFPSPVGRCAASLRALFQILRGATTDDPVRHNCAWYVLVEPISIDEVNMATYERKSFKRFSTAAFTAPKPANNNAAGGGNMPPRGPGALSHLSMVQLKNLEANFVRRGVVVSPQYKLSEVRAEICRRVCNGLNAPEVIAIIVELCAVSPDLAITYSDLHNAVWPTEQFIAHQSIREIEDVMDQVIVNNVQHGQPIVTSLVVRKSDRMLSAGAVKNIYNRCRELGVYVGPSAEQFVAQQAERSRDFVTERYLAA